MEREFKELREEMSYLSDAQWNAFIERVLDRLVNKGIIIRVWDPDVADFICYPVFKS
jgi:hypothetical protein